MPRYLNLAVFVKADSSTGAKYYERTYAPGEGAPVSGIYKCQSCGFETFARREDVLPNKADCNSHSEFWRQPANTKEVTWKLVASTMEFNTPGSATSPPQAGTEG